MQRWNEFRERDQIEVDAYSGLESKLCVKLLVICSSSSSREGLQLLMLSAQPQRHVPEIEHQNEQKLRPKTVVSLKKDNGSNI